MIRRPAIRASFAALLVSSAAVAADSPAPLSFDGADPDIEAANGRTYIYPTNSGDTSRLHVWTSADRRHWQKGAELIRLDQIGWIADDGAPRHALWAPDMVAANGRHYFYFSVGPQNPTPSRIGVATCASLEGPCTDSGKPLVTGGNGFEAIDPMVFVDPASKTPYLYAGGSAGAKLRVWVLKSDMVTIDREIPVETPPHFTEGSFMHARGGTYYFSYSSGSYRHDSYQLHYATAPSPTGPWAYRGKILESDARFKGPGHHAFLHDPKDGRWYIAYHRWEGQTGPGPYKGSRSVAVQPIAYRADGTIIPVAMR